MKTGRPPTVRSMVYAHHGVTLEVPQEREEDDPMRLYAGLDAHSKQSVWAVQDERGQGICQGEVPTTPEGLALLKTSYHLPAGTRVALETGTMAFFVARHLSRLGFEPVVVDAHEVRLKAHRPLQKSDRRDALELCEGLRRGISTAQASTSPLSPSCACGRPSPGGGTSLGS